MKKYKNLFNVLRKFKNFDTPITPDIMIELGMEKVLGIDNVYYSDSMASSYVSVNITDYDTVLDAVENIIMLDQSSFLDDLAEEAAGENW